MNTQDTFAERFGDLVGRGAQAAVYARGDIAVKVYNAGYAKGDVFYEAAMLGFVEAAGLATPRAYEVLEVSGHMCLTMSRVTGRSFDEVLALDLGRAGELMDDLVRLQMDIHAKPIPLPVSLRHRLRERISYNGHLDSARRQALLALCDRMPDGDALCHGDFHGANILVEDGRYAVIDWIEVAKGNPLVDAAHSYTAIAISSRALAELYLERYCIAAGVNGHDVLRWLPIQAGSLYGLIPDRFGVDLLRMVDGQW
jgi:aminoglycoside phosphotransferase (APT) family kinase protein